MVEEKRSVIPGGCNVPTRKRGAKEITPQREPALQKNKKKKKTKRMSS